MRHLVIIALFSMVCSKIPFGESSYCKETSQLSCVANRLTGFCGVWAFAERYFRINYIIFWTKIFPLVIFCILTANFSGLMCQDVLLLIGLQIIFVLIVIQLCHLFPLQVFNNVQLNPGPKKSSSLTFFHWNLNGIAAPDFAKISLIQSHALSYNIDIIFLSKAFLDSSIEANNPKLNIPGYNLLRSDHPSNIKRGGVCMFYKDYLPVIRRDDLCALTKCIVVEVNSGTKSLFFTCNYRSPSQTVDEFERYCQSLHLTLTNIDDTSPFSSVLIGDFNARCTNWWAADIDSKAGKELDSLTSTAGYTQLIDKPTHFFSGGCSCIDLIFCNKPELISEYGIDHSLFQTYHHNLIFGKINAKIPVPPAYTGRTLLKIYQLMRKLIFLTQHY